MTLGELENLLTKLQRDLPQPYFVARTWARPAGVFALLDRQTSAALGATIPEIARTQVLPPLSDDEKVMLAFRVHWAWHILAALTQTGTQSFEFPNPQWSVEEAVRWSLVEAWEWPGAEYLRNLLETFPGRPAAAPPEADPSN